MYKSQQSRIKCLEIAVFVLNATIFGSFHELKICKSRITIKTAHLEKSRSTTDTYISNFQKQRVNGTCPQYFTDKQAGGKTLACKEKFIKKTDLILTARDVSSVEK